MEKISLSDLVAKKGQASVARALGVSPASIAKAISAGRNIVVTVQEDGSYTAKESRSFPSQKGTTAEPSGVQSDAGQAGTDSMSRRPV